MAQVFNDPGLQWSNAFVDVTGRGENRRLLPGAARVRITSR